MCETKSTGGCDGLAPLLRAAKSLTATEPRSVWVYFPQGLLRRAAGQSGVWPCRQEFERRLVPHQCAGTKSGLAETKEPVKGEANEKAPYPGQSLFQESFFFCAVKNPGDLPATGCIYVETVVDSASGAAFAKIYPARCALNAVDILATRVVPFFERMGASIGRISTRRTREYCGLAPLHPFQTFLMISGIEHHPTASYDEPSHRLCSEFYRTLQREFFPRALRKKFDLSLDELQRELDAFLETYNSERMSGAAPPDRARAETTIPAHS